MIQENVLDAIISFLEREIRAGAELNCYSVVLPRLHAEEIMRVLKEVKRNGTGRTD